MKAAIAILFAAALMAVGRPNGNIQLQWDYPTNEIRADMTFYIFTTTNISIPMTNWPMLTNVAGTNLSVNVTITPGQQYFVCASSNFWEQGFSNQLAYSNIAQTPPTAKTNTISVKKLP